MRKKYQSYRILPARTVSATHPRIFEKKGGGILFLALQAKTRGGGPGGGSTLGPMLKSLQRGPKRGVRTPWFVVHVSKPSLSN